MRGARAGGVCHAASQGESPPAPCCTLCLERSPPLAHTPLAHPNCATQRRNKRNRSLLASGQDQGEGKSSWAGAAGGESRPRGMTELKTPRGGPKGVTWDESVAEDKRAGAEGKTTEGGGGNPLPSLTPAPPGLSPRLGYEARTEGQDPAMGRPPAHGKAAYSRRGRREKDPPRHGRDPGRSHRSKSRRARDPSTEHDGSKTAESSPSDWAGDGRDPDDATSTTSRSRRRGKSRHRRRDRDRDRERPSPSRGASRRGRHHRHGRPPSQHGGEGAQSSSQGVRCAPVPSVPASVHSPSLTRRSSVPQNRSPCSPR